MEIRRNGEADGDRASTSGDRWLTVAVWLGAAGLLLTGLGALDLWAPDEPRYAAVAEELRSFRHGLPGLALLHLGGEAYTQKPPLYFWLAALAGAPGGAVTEWAARLPSALCGIAAVGLLMRFGAGLLGRRSGAIAGLLLLTAFEFAHRARRVQLDVLLTLLELVSMVAFWRIACGSERRRDVACLHGAMGLAVLAKGPVGLLVPFLVIGGWLLAEGRWTRLRELAPAWALALSLGPGLAWAALAFAFAPPGSLEDAVNVNLLGRFFSGSSHARPFLYFFYQFPINFWRFLLLWVLVHFLFFSLSAGKRGLYLLPAFPAAALLCADAVVLRLAERRAAARWLPSALAATAFALALVAVAAVGAGEIRGVRVPVRFGAAVAAIALGAAGAWALAGRLAAPRWARAGVVGAAVVALELALFTLALPALDPQKSPRPVAQTAARLAAPGEPIGLAFKGSLLGGLVYYADRPVARLDDRGAVARFVAGGGRVIVLPAARLIELAQVVPVTVRARARRGARALLVVAAAAAEPGASASEREASAQAELAPPSPDASAPRPGGAWPGGAATRGFSARRISAETPPRSMPRSGRANTVQIANTEAKFVIGELNRSRATGTTSRQVAAETSAIESVAANSTHASAATWARKNALNSSMPRGTASASRRRDIGTATVSASSVTDGQKPRR
jgi:4-amino-4-deoxy-L-arabinose transferase-like glycosyltransferase